MVSEAVSVGLAGVRRRQAYWRLTGALVLQVLALSIALVGLIQGPTWWFALMLTSSFLLVAGACLRAVGVHRRVVPLLLLLLSAMVMTVGFGNGTGVLGLIPTAGTVQRWGDYLQQAMLSIYQQGTPAESLPEFLFLVVGGACIIAIVLDALAIAFRIPAYTAIGVVAVLVVPGALLGAGLDPTALAASAAAFL